MSKILANFVINEQKGVEKHERQRHSGKHTVTKQIEKVCWKKKHIAKNNMLKTIGKKIKNHTGKEQKSLPGTKKIGKNTENNWAGKRLKNMQYQKSVRERKNRFDKNTLPKTYWKKQTEKTGLEKDEKHTGEKTLCGRSKNTLEKKNRMQKKN